MRVMKFGALAVSCGLVLGLLTLAGCGGSPTSNPNKEKTNGDDHGTVGGGEAKPVKAGTAVIEGVVTFEGDMPDMGPPESAVKTWKDGKGDKEHCQHDKAPAYDRGNPAWNINKDNKGVEYVAVFLRPEGETFFAVTPEDKAYKAKTAKNPEVDQPFCAFVPNTVVVFSKYKDEKKASHSTGQTLVIKNNTDKSGAGDKGIAHNSKITKSNGDEVANQSLQPGSELPVKDLAPSDKAYTIGCSIHPWMSGSVMVLDHPYFDVTDKDGKFKIENAPAGDVRLIVWHNVKGVINGGGKGEVIKLKDGETTKKEFKISK
jgi:hypothetical protein